ncbi:MAG: hypothetical protein KKE51_00845 [Gammaproteobacteria bacterium]|nr:hypothetical protein [Gammaproteobacteria bacterium]MBU1600538.1 hypothetical protein [Gammaproteobacteria bacterium]MBU2434994.1 hypothetical protein [Gammaproteobacteria bacterium]MBU2448230.1 hypothetical protein [Gammaproteobacteria bacterium]
MHKLLLAPLLLLSLGSANAAGEFYCCHDPNNGRRVCSDVLPEQCRGRAYRVLDSGGNLIKEVGAALTPEEKAERIVEDKRRKELEAASRQQRRRDQALLDTYSMPEDIDLAQRKAEADVNLAILATIARIDQARTKRKKFENEAEFYKKKALPPDLERDLRAIDHEIKLQQDLLEIKKRDFEIIKAKYDADRKRYFELTRRPLPATPAPKR